MELLGDVFSHPEDLLPESVRFYQSHWTQAGSQVSHRTVYSPHITRGCRPGASAERILTQATGRGEQYLQDNASEWNKLIEFTSLVSSKILYFSRFQCLHFCEGRQEIKINYQASPQETNKKSRLSWKSLGSGLAVDIPEHLPVQQVWSLPP